MTPRPPRTNLVCFGAPSLFTGRRPGNPSAAGPLIALLNLVAQIVFRRELESGRIRHAQCRARRGRPADRSRARRQPGVRALPRASITAPSRPRASRRFAPPPLATETFAWIWGALCLVLVFVLAPVFDLPRFSLQLFTLMNVLIAIGGVISSAVCERGHRLRLWAWLLAAAALARVLVGCGPRRAGTVG